MSQGDYIKFKKTAAILQEPKKLPKVLSNNEYAQFKTYNAEMNTQIDKYQYYHVYEPSTRFVFDIVLADPTTCKNLTYCTPKPTPVDKLPFLPASRPLAPKVWKSRLGKKATTAYQLGCASCN